jgi:hypothetical protein
MTANKKSTSKVTKSPAPATKPAAKPAKSKAKPAVAPVAPVVPPKVEVVTPVTPPRVTVASAPASAPVAPTAPAAVALAPTVARVVAPVVSKPLVTTITARINVGFGNALYLRGEGAGLSWDRGVQMTCVSATEWLITLPESARPVVFKFLINDAIWSTGSDYSAVPGTSTLLSPTF